MDKQRLQKICVIVAFISLPVFLLTTVFVSIVDASIENMVRNEIGDIAIVTGGSISALKDNMRSMIVNGELPILNTLFNNDQSLTSFSNTFLKQAVSEVLAQTDFFSRLCIMLWAHGENVKQISLICFIGCVAVWYLTGGRPSDIRDALNKTSNRLKQINIGFTCQKEDKTHSPNDAISISKSTPLQQDNPESFYKKISICALVAAVVLVGSYFVNQSPLRVGTSGSGQYLPPTSAPVYITAEPYALPTPTPTWKPTPTTFSQTVLRGLTNQRLSTRSGPGTQYSETGSYNNLANKWVEIRSRAWDNRNDIWWVEVNIDGRWLWTGYKRFDSSTIPLSSIPINNNY